MLVKGLPGLYKGHCEIIIRYGPTPAALFLCRESTGSAVDSQHKGPVIQSFHRFIAVSMYYCLNKQATSAKKWDVSALLWRYLNTVWCRYNAVNFLKNIHKRHPIARPLGRGMGCLLGIHHLSDILPEFLQSFMQSLAILDRVITALDCITNNIFAAITPSSIVGYAAI